MGMVLQRPQEHHSGVDPGRTFWQSCWTSFSGRCLQSISCSIQASSWFTSIPLLTMAAAAVVVLLVGCRDRESICSQQNWPGSLR